MNKAIGLIIVGLFVIFGAYIAFYEMFISGIVQVYTFFKPVSALTETDLAFGIAKIFFAGPVFAISCFCGFVVQYAVTGKNIVELINE